MVSPETANQILWFLAVGVVAFAFGFALHVSMWLQPRPFKSKMAWLTLLMVRLPLMAVCWLLIVDLLCWLVTRLDATSIDFIRGVLTIAGLLLAVGWVVGSAWVIRFRWPLFASRSLHFQWRVAGGVAVVLVGLLWLVGAYVAEDDRPAIGRFVLEQLNLNDSFDDTELASIEWAPVLLASGQFPIFNPYLSEFASPSDPANEIFFAEIGWPWDDSPGLALCVMPKGQRAIRWISFSEGLPDMYQFSHAQWTGDGQVLICTVVAVNEPSLRVGYDFSAGHSVTPRHFEDGLFIDVAKVLEWSSINPVIDKLISAHGGLDQNLINLDGIRHRRHVLPFWQMPASRFD